MATKLGIPGLKTFYLMQIMLTQTDEEHALNATELSRILKKDYGVSVSRQTIYTEIEKLDNYGLDINKIEDQKSAGYFIGAREFELPELKLLVDAVQSSKFITEKKSRELIEKLMKLCSKQQGTELAQQVIMYKRPKTENETIYYNVDMLHSAIYHDLQVTYQYAEWTVKKTMEPRHGGEPYVVSPLSLVWDDENYYLVAFDEKAGKVKHYRVDKMQKMEILQEKRSEAAKEQMIDPVAFSKKTFGMFGGKDVKIRLVCENYMAGVILDRFGTDIWMHPTDEEHFLADVTVTVSPQFYGWLLAVGEGIEIMEPGEVREAYRDYVRRVMERYEGQEE